MFGDNGAGRDQMLAVVEDQQRARLAELGTEAFKGRALRGQRQTERGGSLRRHQRGIAEASQLHQPDTIVARAQPRRRSLDSEASLARPTGAGQREQAIAVKQTGNLPQLAVAPDEARQRDRQVMTGRPSPSCAQRVRRLAAQLLIGRVEVDVATQQRLIQARRLRVGLGLEVAPKRLAQPLILRQRVLAATRRGEQPHQRALGAFVQRINHHNLFKGRDSRLGIPALSKTAGKVEQQPQVRLAHRLPPADRPRFVAILREKLAAVKLERRPIIRQLASSASMRDPRLERVDVDLHPPARIQHQHVVPQRENSRGLGARCLQRPPRDIQRLMKVIGRRRTRPLRPQQLSRLLPMNSTLWRQREQLHQALSLT